MGSRFDPTEDTTADRRAPVLRGRLVIPAPPARLVRRSLANMNGRIIARRYRITSALGAGGMGSVYEAVDLQTGRLVALKALQPGAYDTARLKRLRREAATATAVRSDHVCQVDYLGVDHGTPFIVMERLRGENVRARLAATGALPIDQAVEITLQLLDALAATHAAGVIHRDVKPSNVFLLEEPTGRVRIKLIDFGLAKMLRPSEAAPPDGESEAMNITGSDGVPGTLHYLAPEQLLGLGNLDQRVDVYAAGLTFYEMLTGHRAYQGAAYDDIVHQIVLETPPCVGDERPSVPELVDDVLQMAMAKDRERRFASAEAFKTALSAAWRGGVGNSGVRLVGDDCPTLRPPASAVEDDESDSEGVRPTLRPPPTLRDADYYDDEEEERRVRSAS